MTTPQQDLVELCQRLGKQTPLWTQGAGSNVSCKFKENGQSWLRIKASGYRLDNVNTHDGTVDVDLQCCEQKLKTLHTHQNPEEDYAALLKNCVRPGAQLRPSMETGFHVLLPCKFVIHFHSTVAVLMASAYAKDPFTTQKWFQKNCTFTTAWLECIRPGLLLSQAIGQINKAQIILLKNHGVVLNVDSVAEFDQWLRVEERWITDQKLDPLFKILTAPIPLKASEPWGSLPTPMRLFFPDSAVFLQRIQNILIPAAAHNTGEPHYIAKPNSLQIDQDATEIWLATAVLYSLHPQLEEVPHEVATTVGNLPTELIRKNRSFS